MSVQWMLAAGFLYAEIALVLILIFPVFSPTRYNNFFKSNFMKALSNQAQWYFGFILLILALFFVDAIREMHKYSHVEHSDHTALNTEMQHNMRLFRAQRNFYISGFAMFLSLVIRQLVKLISKQAVLLAENEAILKQAKSATTTARNLMKSGSGSGETAENVSNENHQKEIEKLYQEIDKLQSDLLKSMKDKEALVSQSKALETEYDRLQEEHRKIQLKLNVAGGEETKKDD